MEFIFEFIIELYMEMMFLIVPEKNITKKHRTIAKIIAIVELLLIFALVIWGVVLIADYHNMLGWIPIGFAILISVMQIIFGIVFYKKHH